MAVERDYPATYERFTSLGPLMDKLGNGGKGISWNTQDEIDFLGKLNYTKRDGPAQGRPLIDTAIDASEVILALAPETNVPCCSQSVAGAGRDHRTRTYPSGAAQRGREDSLSRYSGAAA